MGETAVSSARLASRLLEYLAIQSSGLWVFDRGSELGPTAYSCRQNVKLEHYLSKYLEESKWVERLCHLSRAAKDEGPYYSKYNIRKLKKPLEPLLNN